MLLGMAAGAALGAVGVMAATQNQRQLRRTTRKVMKGAENAVLQLDRMVGDFVELNQKQRRSHSGNGVVHMRGSLTYSRCTSGQRC